MDFQKEKIEYYILKCLIESEEFIRKYSSVISPDIFTDELKYIAGSVLVFFKSKNKLPQYKIIADFLLPKACKNNENLILETTHQLNNIKELNVEINDAFSSLKDEIEKFIKKRKILNAFGKSLALLEENKHDEIVSTLEPAFQISFDESWGLDYWEDLIPRMKRNSENVKAIPSGYKSLDEIMGGGYRKKSLFAFAGPPNSGKSLILNDAAAHLSLNGYNVLYITLELSEDYVANRTDANYSGISLNQINNDPKLAIEKIIAQKQMYDDNKKNYGKLIYKNYEPNTVNCNDISNLIDRYSNNKKIKFDFLIVDYLKLMKSNGKVMGDNLYNKLGQVCEDMRGLAFRKDLCVLTASATDRSSMNSMKIGMENVSDSIAIVQTVDVFVTIAMDTQVEKQNQVLLSCVKSRYSRRNSTTLMNVDYDHMKLIDIDSNSSISKQHENNIKSSVKNKNSDNDDIENEFADNDMPTSI